MEVGEALKSTTLLVDQPPPPISFGETVFCFTGAFAFGSRRDCERAVIERGARAGNLTKDTNYLVLGIYATESWKHSTFGEKIRRAQEMKAKQRQIWIISEEHWHQHL